MIILSKLLFFMSLFVFTSAAVFWDSLTGVMLWRVGLALGVIGVGVHLLWVGDSKTLVDNEVSHRDTKTSMDIVFLMLSIVQFGLLLIAFAPFYFSLGSGVQFIYTVTIIAPGLLFTSLAWLVLSRYYDIYLLDQLIPYMALVVFFLASSLTSDAILYAKIFSMVLGLLSLFMIYKNWVRMNERKGKGVAHD